MHKVVIFIVDDLRFDGIDIMQGHAQCPPYLDKYRGESLLKTPHMSAQARDSGYFTQAVSACTYTPPSISSILSGVYPPHHGVRSFLKNKLPDRVKTIPQYFKQQGYKVIYSLDFFDIFSVANFVRDADATFFKQDEELYAELEHSRDENVCLVVHIADVHPPFNMAKYVGPDNPDANKDFYDQIISLGKTLGLETDLEAGAADYPHDKVVDLSNAIRLFGQQHDVLDLLSFPRYISGINKWDAGRFHTMVERFKKSGFVGKDALFVFVSDHGQAPIRKEEMVTDRDGTKFDHAECVKEELIRVPLYFHSPGVISPSLFEHQVRTVDIAPTVLDFFSIPYDAKQFDGISLKDALANGTEPPEDWAYSEVWYYDRSELSKFLRYCRKHGEKPDFSYSTMLHERSIRKDGYKYVLRGLVPGESYEDFSPADEVLDIYRKAVGRIPDEAELARATEIFKEKGPEGLEQELSRYAFRKERFYDVVRDPDEQVNLLWLDRFHRGQYSEPNIQKSIERYRKRLLQISQSVSHQEELDHTKDGQLMDRLRSLGYLE